MEVDHGLIKNIRIYGDFFSRLDISDIEAKLIGVNHVYSDIETALSSFDISDYFSNAIIEDVLSTMF